MNSQPNSNSPTPTYLGQTGQIDECQVEDFRTIDSQADRELANPLVLSSNAKGLGLNLLSNFAKIGEPAVGVQELAVLQKGRLRGLGRG